VQYRAFVSSQVTLMIELDDSQVEEFQRLIPVQLALPPWNYTESLDKGITVAATYHSRNGPFTHTLRLAALRW